MTRYQRRRSRIEQRKFRRNVMVHFIIILLIMVVAICMVVRACVKDESAVEEDYHLVAGSTSTKLESPIVTELVHEQEEVVETEGTTDEIVEEPEPEPEFPEFTYSKDWSGEDGYLLAKIAMAEAEGCDTYTKTLVIMTVLNRAQSKQFPNTIEEVLFENHKGVYQFSPCRPNGRWWRVEPDEDCYRALQQVFDARYDYSEGCLFFESCEDEDNWHNRNLEFLFKSGGIRFYR